MRTVNLIDEERRIFFDTEVKEKDIQKLMKEYVVRNINNTKCVLCKKERDDGDDANFMDTGLALTGILEDGETLHDFIEFRLKMRAVINHRNRASVIADIKRKIKKGEI